MIKIITNSEKYFKKKNWKQKKDYGNWRNFLNTVFSNVKNNYAMQTINFTQTGRYD